MERLEMNQIVENSSNQSLQEQCDYEIAHGSSIEKVREDITMQLFTTACNTLQNPKLDDSEMMAKILEELHQYADCETYLNHLNTQNCQRHR